MAKSGIEVVFEGWLTKSPPPKWILRPKWRRRWFTLTYSGEIPGQFVLTYYTDRNCKELKGSIDLDHCEQVDLGLKLEEGEHKFEYVFDIKTPTRTYYLAADSEDEMRSWVDCICKVCGLKSTNEDEDLHISNNPNNGAIFDQEMAVLNSTDTPPISPVSTSPYIPISECITGKSPILDQQGFKTLLQHNIKNCFFKLDLNKVPQQNYINYVNDVQDPRFYDSPRQLAPQKSDNENEKNSPLQSPTDSESVFTDEDWVQTSDLNTSKNTRPSDSSDTQKSKMENDKKCDVIAPPRPPKTNFNQNTSNYLNLTGMGLNEDKSENGSQKQLISDEMYDFPRSHHQIESDQIRNVFMRRHCYNNAAPVKIEGQIFRYDISPKPSTSNTQFRYDLDEQDEPASPVSQSSSIIAYSNLPSPLLLNNTNDNQLMPPPIVNRDLKPKRKLSDSLSVTSIPEPSSPRFGAPSVDRKLKPTTPLQEAHMRKNFSMDETRKSGQKSKFDEDRHFGKGIRTTRSPSLGRSHESLLSQNESAEQIYHYLPGKMQYLDLDLDCGSNFSNNIGTNSLLPKSPDSNNTVYKKVDFMKTQAFNITRNNLEKERKEPVTFLKK